MVAAYLIALASATLGQTSTVSHTATFSDELSSPGRLAPAPGGGVYVTDQATGRVLEYAAGGGAPTVYSVPEGPVGLAYRPDLGDGGRVLVSLANGSLGVYTSGLVPVGGASVVGVLDEPNDMAMYPFTTDIYQVFVVDSGVSQVVVFQEGPLDTWTEVNRFSTDGSGLGQTVHPQAITVDAASGMVIVTDVDNFRAQVFDTSGFSQYRFGHRMFYGGWELGEFAWFARSEGIATDSCGNIYISDALMGMVRVFDPTGNELDAAYSPAVSYGTAAGEVRIPIDVAIEGGQLFVASSYNSAVEVYDVACTLAATTPSRESGLATITSDRENVRSADVRGKVVRAPAIPDNPLDILATIDSGAYNRRSDLNLDRRVDYEDLQIAVDAFGVGTLDDFLAAPGGVADASFHPPHVLDTPDACGRCHGMIELPGGMLSAAGQENLCLSCHTGGGLAMDMPISGSDKGLAHPIGIPADQGVSLGPDPDGLLALHLDGGDIKCSTCHDQHSTLFEPYLRNSIGDADLCGECHFQADEWALAGHSDGDARAFNYPVGPGRESCAKCHSGLGHIDFAAGVPEAERRTDKQVHSCFVCHGVHENGNEHLLRVFGEVELPGGRVVDGEHSANCMACHNGRYAPNTGHSTPHYLPGAVVLLGLNGIEFGNTIDNSAHSMVVGCADCHMADGPADGQPGAGKVGGHTFDLVLNDATDPDDGFENAKNACGSCHSNLLTVNRPAWSDYDGNGVTEGIQDEVAGLLAAVHSAIEAGGAVDLGHYPYWDFSGVDPLDDQTVRDAVWNFELIENDSSLGVHNVGFCVGLLQATYKELTGADLPGATLRYTSGPNARRGGLLYDKWWVVNGAPVPTGNHPLYPAGSAKSGNTTFRCKECHGWDYIGDQGRYESGSHHTGIVGVLNAASNWTTAELFDIIKNPDGDGTGGTTVNGHDFGTYGLGDSDILDLVEFLTTEVIDTAPYIARSGAPGAYSYDFVGDVGSGFGYYSGGLNAEVGCFRCHGADGRAIDFGGGDFLGTLANGNPQETMHKIRFGQPATAMSSLVQLGISDQAAADVGAYSQTLPTAALAGANTVRGGLLYDKWWKVNGAGEPVGDHPLYATGAGTKSGNTTFRCKECHGWDYKGVAGAYASGSHHTGFAGIFGTTMNQTELETFLATGTYPDLTTIPDHVIADLTATDVADLAAFVATELVDTDVYIDLPTKAFISPDLGNGFGYYSGALDGAVSCYICHGTDGRAIDFGGGKFVGTVATGNPWETLHKIRFGQPATAMCSFVQLGHTVQDAADVGGYAQTLPVIAAVGGDTVRGGLLYDKWWKVNGALEPTGDHPLYPVVSAKSGSTTFRCKECHGWDYIGDLGRYESGSHYTGIMGVLNAAATWTDAELFDIIKNPDGDGTGGTTVNGHDLGAYGLGDTDINDLVGFLANGVADTSPYINTVGVPGSFTYSFNGTPALGATLYGGGVDPVANCSLCHGADGTAIDFGGGTFVGTVANANPQETLHKVRFGHPGSSMTSYFDLGMTDLQAADIGAFAETLP